MNRRQAIQTTVMGAAAAAVPVARAAGKDLEVFLARWDKAKVFTLQVADAMPADAYDFKPKPEMRPYGQLIQHLATNNAFYISRFKAGEIPDSLQPPEKFDKETTKTYVAASFDFCARVLKGVSEADLDKSYPGRPNTPPQTGWDWVLHAFIHTAHHRGYAEVYLREKGITPPRYSV
ncbi:MAG TPA: DinB family protein [Bryobacteraceae bacterium]